MSNVCQIIYFKTLDTLDKMVYTLDILAANIEQATYGGDHGNRIGRGNEKRGSTAKSTNVFCGHR